MLGTAGPELSDGLVLTSNRLIRVWPEYPARIVGLGDVEYMEIDLQDRSIPLLILVGALMLLALIPLALGLEIPGEVKVIDFVTGRLAPTLSLLGSVAILVFALLAGYIYWRSGSASFRIVIDGETVYMKVSGDSLGQVAEFIYRYLRTKSAVNQTLQPDGGS